MLATCIVILLTLHLLSVNIAAGGPIVCIWCEWRESKGDELAGRAGRYLASTSWKALLVGGVLGVGVGLLAWTPEFVGALERLEAKVYWGIGEIFFSLVLMLVHLALWKKSPQCRGGKRTLRCLLPLMSGTNLLYHFPVLFALISKISRGEVVGEGKIDSSMFRSLIADASIWSQTIHVWLASFAVVGVVMIGYSMSLERKGDEEAAKRTSQWGGRLGLTMTMAQMPVGIWLTLQLSDAAKERLMGGDWPPAALLGLSVGLTFSLMHYLAAIALGDEKRKTKVRAMMVLVVIVLLMTSVLRTIH